MKGETIRERLREGLQLQWDRCLCDTAPFNAAQWADAILNILSEPGVVEALVAMERAFGRTAGDYTSDQVAAVSQARRALCEHFDVKAATEPCAKVVSQTHG